MSQTADSGNSLPSPSRESRRDFLLAGAAWQDSLLQSYRLIFLTLHSIFFAIGIGIFITSLGNESTGKDVTISVGLLLLSFATIYMILRMRRIVHFRGNDINFWHRQIIKLENSIAASARDFTRFKIIQKSDRDNDLEQTFMNGNVIDDHDIDRLIEKGLGHTRRIIDNQLFIGLTISWAILDAAVLVHLAQLSGAKNPWR